MSLRNLLMMMRAPADPGQEQWTTPGAYTWEVPAGVFEISGVVVGGGGDSTGDGGGLHWRNSMPVAPGETLNLHVGANDRFSSDPIESHLKRGSTYLLRATHVTFAGTLGGGGGDGGQGSANTDTGGGGAGGYMGDGGDGGTGTSNPPETDSGGGFSGSTGDGGGVGLQGRTPDFAPGSLGTPKCGGGLGEGQSAGPGGVRIMWGVGRSYPDNAADV